jgi:riboflavin biosynthesis pyrimidine reductase
MLVRTQTKQTPSQERKRERTSLERKFRPDDIRRMKHRSARDISVRGPTLAAAALRARLVDEIRLFLQPISVGGGLPALPRDARLALKLEQERRFESGTVNLRHLVVAPGITRPHFPTWLS